jgi:hypothetical protein
MTVMFWVENRIFYTDAFYNDYLPNNAIRMMKKCDSIYFDMEYNLKIYSEYDENYRIPDCITKITYSEYSYFNKKLTIKGNETITWLPPNLKYLSFGENFNRPVDVLPKSLTHLTFGNDFNQPVNSLPTSLVYLKFGDNFNQPVDSLPSSLTHLTLGSFFDKSTDNLPDSIVELWIEPIIFNKFKKFPKSLERLYISEKQVDFEKK